MWSVLTSIFLMLAVIWGLDFLVLPKKDADRGKNHAITFLWLTPPGMLFFSLLMLTYRPIFSSVITIATYATIVILNNAKVKTLKEPLVYSDFSLFREVIRHPHLYVKYIGLHNVVLIGLCAVATGIGGFGFEEPFINRARIEDYFPTLLFFLLSFGTIYLIIYGPLKKQFKKILLGLGPDANVSKNVAELGLVVCLIFYFFLSGTDKIKADPPQSRSKVKDSLKKIKTKDYGSAEQHTEIGAPSLFHAASEGSKKKLPNIIAIQAESFFDVRYLTKDIDPEILSGYDSIIKEATFHGRLTVPAWGAYTMRTEFAFLSGLPEAALGHHRYNPYLQLGRQPFWTLAHTLKSLGYETVCVHPFPATFFNRKKVFPNLGFDHFIDMSAFDKKEQFGPYIGDIALGQKISELVDKAERPLFVFAITMENHGAWSKDRLKREDKESMNAENWPLGCYSLSHYIAHMRNTDQMITNLKEHLQSKNEPGMICLYGDHMPNLKNALTKTEYDDPRTDYFIWRTNGQRQRQLNTSADVLSRLLLDVALNERRDNHPEEEDVEILDNRRDIA
ncbi:MAG: LTA synthase family protein [Sneathiella sp.]|nr:LTA synthase family protein [Sneathiella sp.]